MTLGCKESNCCPCGSTPKRGLCDEKKCCMCAEKQISQRFREVCPCAEVDTAQQAFLQKEKTKDYKRAFDRGSLHNLNGVAEPSEFVSRFQSTYMRDYQHPDIQALYHGYEKEAAGEMNLDASMYDDADNRCCSCPPWGCSDRGCGDEGPDINAVCCSPDGNSPSPPNNIYDGRGGSGGGDPKFPPYKDPVNDYGGGRGPRRESGEILDRGRGRSAWVSPPYNDSANVYEGDGFGGRGVEKRTRFGSQGGDGGYESEGQNQLNACAPFTPRQLAFSASHYNSSPPQDTSAQPTCHCYQTPCQCEYSIVFDQTKAEEDIPHSRPSLNVVSLADVPNGFMQRMGPTKRPPRRSREKQAEEKEMYEQTDRQRRSRSCCMPKNEPHAQLKCQAPCSAEGYGYNTTYQRPRYTNICSPNPCTKVQPPLQFSNANFGRTCTPVPAPSYVPRGFQSRPPSPSRSLLDSLDSMLDSLSAMRKELFTKCY